MIFRVVFCLLSLFSLSFTSTSVWKVSNSDGNYIYVVGSVHHFPHGDFFRKEVLPFFLQFAIRNKPTRDFENNEFLKAYINSDIVVLETETKDNSKALEKYWRENIRYKDGKTLKDFISKDIYAKLKAYIIKNNIPMDLPIKYKLGYLYSLFSYFQSVRNDLTLDGVDELFELVAKDDKKSLVYLENIKVQMDVLINMGNENKEKFAQYILKMNENYKEQLDILLKSWKNGKINLAQTQVLDEFKEEFPEIYDSLLINRNQKWLLKIGKMFDSKEVECVVVGFLHLVGSDGILEKLQKKGFKVEQL